MEQPWEYLEVAISPDGKWFDGTGREGRLTMMSLGSSGWSSPSVSALCTEWAQEGWELHSVLPSLSDQVRFTLLFRRPYGLTGP